MDLVTWAAHLSEWLGVVAITWILSISPRFQRPPVGFKYPRREGIMSLAIFGLISIAAFLVYQANPPQLPSVIQWTMPPQVALPQALLLAGVSLIPVVVALVARGQPPKSAGWNPQLMMPAIQMGAAAGILTIFLRNRVFEVLLGFNSANLMALLMAFGITLAEESIFRGFIQPRLAAWLGDWPSIGASALLFAAWHAIAWVGRMPAQSALVLFAIALAQGIVLGWVFYKSKHVMTGAIYRALSIWVLRF